MAALTFLEEGPPPAYHPGMAVPFFSPPVGEVTSLAQSLERMPVVMSHFSGQLRSLYAENDLPVNATTSEYLK